MQLVRERGRRDGRGRRRRSQTGMSAVIGGDEAELLAKLAELGLCTPRTSTAAARSSSPARSPPSPRSQETPPAGRAGHPAAGRRRVPHPLHGVRPSTPCAHSPPGSSRHDPTLPIWTNKSGETVTDGRLFLDLLVGQVASPVRWDLTMESFAKAGITGLIELAPGGRPRRPRQARPQGPADRRGQDPRRPRRRPRPHRQRRSRRMTTLKQSTGAAVHAHPRLRRRARRPRRAELRARRGDRLERRVDPPAHRHHHAASARARAWMRSTSPRPPRSRRSRTPASSRARSAPCSSRRSATSRSTPSMSSLLADRIGATPAPAYDISAACAGYTYAIAQADALIRSGAAEYVLVVGAEKLSQYVVDPDRPLHLVPARRRRRRGRRRPGRRAGHLADASGAPTARSGTPSA